MSTAARWADLLPRLGSAIVMVGVAGGAVMAGGMVFQIFVALVCAVMIWELVRMLEPDRSILAMALAGLAGLAVLVSPLIPFVAIVPVLLIPAAIGLVLVASNRGLFTLFAAWIALAGFGFILIRDLQGIDGMLWLICVVVMTDVAGYFAGKMIGGPKFWPRVSPKKTWSGTVAGWVGAALVGYGFVHWAGFGAEVIVLSVLAAFASQAGDVAESAIKRKTGIKDSSALIPGHGGFLDRFDGMMGASALVLLVAVLTGYLPGAM